MLKTEIFKKYCEEENLEEKEENLRLSLFTDSENIVKLRELAAITYYKKNYNAAIKIYEKLIKLEPENGDNFAFYGFLNYEMENYEEAIKYFLEAIDKIKDAPFVHFLLGNAYSRIGQIVEATRHYDLAIFSHEDIYKIHLEFAKKYEEMGRNKKAYREYIAAYEIDPRDKKILEKIEMIKAKIM